MILSSLSFVKILSSGQYFFLGLVNIAMCPYLARYHRYTHFSLSLLLYVVGCFPERLIVDQMSVGSSIIFYDGRIHFFWLVRVQNVFCGRLCVPQKLDLSVSFAQPFGSAFKETLEGRSVSAGRAS